VSTQLLEVGELAIPVFSTGPARRARLTVDRDGSIHLRAAPDVSADELHAFVSSKRDWIIRKLAQKETVTSQTPSKELVSGEGFAYLGRNYRLAVTGSDLARVKLSRGRLLLPRSLLNRGGSAIVDWYEERARAWLPARATSWAARLRVDPVEIEVADLGHRWGSTTVDGRVRIHWATLQLSPLLVDYVLAHELSHLREANHGPAFWRTLSRAQPDYVQRKDELARTGSSVWLGTIQPTSAEPSAERSGNSVLILRSS
jgi:predicted metal-dependent hydrolase